MQDKSFDYIIAGGGMAGLSLGFYLNESSLKSKKILIIDRDEKTSNDHTWCFWENGKSDFEEIIFRCWDKFWFHGTQDFSELLDFDEYQYKMIRAIDFYEFVKSKLEQNSNFKFLQADISSVENKTVKTDKGEFTANEYIFDSFSRKEYDNPKYHNLWQHFLGWVIETEDAVFDSDEMTLFDFRIEQMDECRFIYILPFSENKALIEFTIFSDNLIEREEYEENLRIYVSKNLQIENYTVQETEFGIIPMSDEPHTQTKDSKIIRIGTSGGFVKPSTGYSFKSTQRKLKKLVEDLEKRQEPKLKHRNWKLYLDSVLLNVMQDKKHSIDDVFTCLFKKNKASRVLKFLNEDTSLTEDFSVMKTVPLKPFTIAAFHTIFKKIR